MNLLAGKNNSKPCHPPAQNRVIKLKGSSVNVIDGIRQFITNHEGIFNKQFFFTALFLRKFGR